MKERVILALNKSGVCLPELESLIEIPKDSHLGDFAFPCFVLAKHLKKSPTQIATELADKIDKNDFDKVQATGPYVNFFIKKITLASNVLKKVHKEKDKYGSSNDGSGKRVVIDFSSPNIAKPFGIGHLRSTIIGNSLSNIFNFSGFKTIKINYLGDWGTQFGKLIVAYKKWGDLRHLKKNPIFHLQELYKKINSMPDLEAEARAEFKKLEDGDKENTLLWRRFRKASLNEFNKIYDVLGVKFDVISGESQYKNKTESVVKLLEKKELLEASEGAKVVDLERYGLGMCLIKKSDGATLYATRDLTAAIDRHNKYKFNKMIYEVGAEQKLHFKQVFKVLELLGFSWAKECSHISHGLYLDEDGKKFSTRKGKIIYLEDILNEAIALAKEEINRREKISKFELEKRAKLIALSAIIYGDLKNYRENDIIFNIKHFISFEGNTGPYLLYTYARANSILAKKKLPKKYAIYEISEIEKRIIIKLNDFPEIVKKSCEQLAPNLIANYAYSLAQEFNEFYHNSQVIGSEQEGFRLHLVWAIQQVIFNSLYLLGIKSIKRM